MISRPSRIFFSGGQMLQMLREVEEQDQDAGQQAFPRADIGRKIPGEQHQDAESEEKFEPRTHSIGCFLVILSCRRSGSHYLALSGAFNTLVMADFSISIFTLSATFTITVVSFTFEISP